LLAQGRPYAEAAAAAIQRFAPAWVLVAARGSSDNAARYAQYLFGVMNGLGVGLAVPSLISVYAAHPNLRRALVIGISQSGQSPDIVSVLAEARSQDGLTLALTNDPDSPLALAAELTMPILAGTESAVAATKTYTNELMALAMLSTSLSGHSERWQELEALPASVQLALDNSAASQAVAVARTFGHAGKFFTVGRGFNYATAFEIALKIKETSYVIAEPYSPADLLHGPIAMIGQGFPGILVAPSGQTVDELSRLLELLNQRRAEVAVISDVPKILALTPYPLPLTPGVPEWLSPIVAVVPGQLFALELALSRGIDPDSPRGLSKVTRTR
jgi:glucosamine--fructose-6-phosphate aminotransferase (isomerizing)